jgi:hypothetical protein
LLAAHTPAYNDEAMSARKRKEQWVRDAVAITDVLTKDGGGRYLCPLCLRWFVHLDDLSLEHAPPRSVGGRHMAVTLSRVQQHGGGHRRRCASLRGDGA